MSKDKCEDKQTEGKVGMHYAEGRCTENRIRGQQWGEVGSSSRVRSSSGVGNHSNSSHSDNGGREHRADEAAAATTPPCAPPAPQPPFLFIYLFIF